MMVSNMFKIFQFNVIYKFITLKASKYLITSSYIAGDYVKFNLPGAQALTTLAWGGISYAGGYKCAGEWENLLDAIKWGTDYFIKCHVSDNEYYAQV